MCVSSWGKQSRTVFPCQGVSKAYVSLAKWRHISSCHWFIYMHVYDLYYSYRLSPTHQQGIAWPNGTTPCHIGHIRKNVPLYWRHNGHACVSNHQRQNCLLNRIFRRRSKKTSKLRVTGLWVGNSPGPVNSPHKWPVTLKMFPFDDVNMQCVSKRSK